MNDKNVIIAMRVIEISLNIKEIIIEKNNISQVVSQFKRLESFDFSRENLTLRNIAL
jgi:hypothetical protein